MSKVEDYRRHARDCLLLADQIGTQEGRAALIAMAQRWYELAKQAEREERSDKTPNKK